MSVHPHNRECLVLCVSLPPHTSLFPYLYAVSVLRQCHVKANLGGQLTWPKRMRGYATSNVGMECSYAMRFSVVLTSVDMRSTVIQRIKCHAHFWGVDHNARHHAKLPSNVSWRNSGRIPQSQEESYHLFVLGVCRFEANACAPFWVANAPREHVACSMICWLESVCRQATYARGVWEVHIPQAHIPTHTTYHATSWRCGTVHPLQCRSAWLHFQESSWMCCGGVNPP